jgi:hypothetical protein
MRSGRRVRPAWGVAISEHSQLAEQGRGLGGRQRLDSLAEAVGGSHLSLDHGQRAEARQPLKSGLVHRAPPPRS